MSPIILAIITLENELQEVIENYKYTFLLHNFTNQANKQTNLDTIFLNLRNLAYFLQNI
jgi:hypothetical protein